MATRSNDTKPQAAMPGTASEATGSEVVALSRKHRRRTQAAGRACIVVIAAIVAAAAVGPTWWQQESASQGATAPPAFLELDEKDGHFCGKDGDMCKCFGHVRYGRLLTLPSTTMSSDHVKR